MVVIRKNLKDFESAYGKDSLNQLLAYADIIGYSLESDSNEIRIELNPDRPDLMSFPTLFHSCQNYSNPTEWKNYSSDASTVVSIAGGGLKLRPFVFGFTARGKPLGNLFDDLIDFQEKLHLTVGKNRKKSSIGIHDMDKISLPARYDSGSKKSTVFTTYDGTVKGSAEEILKTHPKGIEYGGLIPKGAEVPLIMDSDGDILSMPPVINGRKSMIDSGSKNFFVDVTGTDLHVCLGTMFLMMNFFSSLGYKVGLATANPKETGHDNEIASLQERRMDITEREVKEFIGAPVELSTIVDVLARMGYSILNAKFPLSVGVPPFRIDVMGPADILEDLAKGIGYDNIEPRPMVLGTIGTRNSSVEFANTVRNVMLGAGFQEVMTFVIGSQSKYRQVQYRGKISILNPKSLDFSTVRDRLTLNLMEIYQNNKTRSYPQNIFEIGEIVFGGKQESRISVSTASSRASFSEIKKVVDYLTKRLLGVQLAVEPISHEIFIEGRSSTLSFKGMKVGIMGEMKPEILDQFTMKMPVAMAELDLTVMKKIFTGNF